MIVFWILGLYLACGLIFLGKSIADITSNETSWRESFFSKYKITSFFGSKEHTFIRKDHKNPILNWLYHNPLVFVTDIWHLANTVRRLGIYGSVFFAILVGSAMVITAGKLFWMLTAFAALNILGFHLFYHWILRKKV